jgi:nucleotide-binding universal stress UspA family protein
MFKLLIPTDFSDSALKATEYGLGLAGALKSEVLLFHATGLPMLQSTEDVELLASRDLERMENEQLARVKYQMKQLHPEVIVSVNSTTGFAVEEIKNACNENNIDLVVMGTKGAGGLKEVLVGSNTGSLIHSTDCPVLAVPEEAVFKGLNHIVFATNMLKDDIQSIRNIIRLFGSMQPKITLLHIEDGHQRDAEAAVTNWFRTEVLPTINYPSLEVEVIPETDIIKTLHTFLDDHKADLLVTATRKRNLIERIFDRSITHKLVYHTHIPLLALHTHGTKGEMVL